MRTFRIQQKPSYLTVCGGVIGLAGLAYGSAVRLNLAPCATSLLLCPARAEERLSSHAGILPVEVPPDAVSAATPVPLNSPDRAKARARVNRAYGRLPLSFEENRGQADSRVRFLSRGQGYRVFVTTTETVLVLQPPSTLTPRPVEESAVPHSRYADGAGSAPSTVLTMTLIGANHGAPSVGLEELPGKVNYFMGNDPARWQKDVRTYAKVEARNVYPGVNMVHRGNRQQLEYDFVVAPGADPGDIRVSFSGMQKMHVDSGGDLVLTTPTGEIRQHKPYIYQERAGVKQAIAGRYLLKGSNEIGFAVGPYDASVPLVIDPVLAYSTYLGGSVNDEGRDVAVDASGNAYIAGVTGSPSTFPRVGGILTVTGGLEAFVSKLNAAGDSLIYSTFLGDEASESADAIAVDDSGQAYITGFTRSPNFPTTAGGYQRGINTGNFSAFVTRLNAAGNGLVYSTFLGGSTASTGGAVAQQEGLGIAVDSTGHAYITGWTNAVDFPQFNGYQGSNGGQIDGFVTKLDTNEANAASLDYSTYLGGGGIDRGADIAVDSTGHAYVTGHTDSGAGTAPFPTQNAVQGALAGGVDAFVAKLDTLVSGASSLVYSTYLGGGLTENPNTPWPGGIAVDSLGYAYVTGSTNSWSSSATPFPTTATAYQPTTSGVGDLDAFLTKLSPAGTAIVYSTFFGGSGNDVGRGVAVDATGHAYVTGEAGQTSSGDFPSRNAVQPGFGGGILDAFVAKIDTGASGDASLVYSTFLGGSDAELGFAIALGSTGDAYVTGKTTSAGLATAGAYQGFLGNAPGGVNSDAFVAKIEETIDTTPPAVTAPAPVTIEATEPSGATGSASAVLAAFLAGGSATDTVDPSPVRLTPQFNGADVTNATLLPIGTSTVTFRFQDASTNIGTADSTVTVTAPPPICAADVTGSVTVMAGGIRFDKRTGRYTQRITLRGNSPTALEGPISFVLDNLTAGVTLLASTGATTCAAPLGSQYVGVNVGSDDVLSERERVTLNLEFQAPQGSTISYAPRILGGSGIR